MNSTLKSLVFWMVLVVVAVGVWNFSTKFETPSKLVAFSDFMRDVEAGKIEKVTITGQEISGIFKADKETFHTYAPAQYEGLANKLDRTGHPDYRQRADAKSLGAVAVFVGADPPADWLLDLLHAPDAERRQQGALVRQKQGEALVELAEESDVQGRRGC